MRCRSFGEDFQYFIIACDYFLKDIRRNLENGGCNFLEVFILRNYKSIVPHANEFCVRTFSTLTTRAIFLRCSFHISKFIFRRVFELLYNIIICGNISNEARKATRNIQRSSF